MMKQTLVIQAPILTISGYGERSRDLFKALHSIGKYDIKIIPTIWGSTPHIPIADIPSELRESITKQLFPTIDIFIQVTIPSEFQPRGRFNIGITAGIETTICAPNWIEGCNRMDLILVSSNHSKNVFEQAVFDKLDSRTNVKVGELRLAKPIEVLFEGIDFNKFNGIHDRNLPISKQLRNIKSDINYLFVGHWLGGELYQDRKNVAGMIRAFLYAFAVRADEKTGPQPGLILKTSTGAYSEMDKSKILDMIDTIRQSVLKELGDRILPKIHLIYGDLPDNMMNALYSHPKVSAMISLTRGEGFGRPLLEFVTTGKPIIATDWSGHLDFLKGSMQPNGWQEEITGYHYIGYDLVPVHKSVINPFLIDGAQWAEYNSTMVFSALMNVYNNISVGKQANQLVDKSHIRYVMNTFSLDKMAEKLKSILETKVRPVSQFVPFEISPL